MPKPLTTGNIAKAMGVAPRTVSKWIDTGRLKGYRLPGSLDRRVTQEAFAQFLADYRIPPIDGLSSTILLVGVDAVLEARLRQQVNGSEIVATSNGFEAGKVCLECRPGAVVIDSKIGHQEARHIAESVRRAFNKAFIVGLEDMAGSCKASAFDEYFQKPLDIPLLADRIMRRRPNPEPTASSIAPVVSH